VCLEEEQSSDGDRLEEGGSAAGESGQAEPGVAPRAATLGPMRRDFLLLPEQGGVQFEERQSRVKKECSSESELQWETGHEIVQMNGAGRIEEITTPRFDCEFDDPEYNPAVRYFLTRCPSGRADKSSFVGSCRWSAPSPTSQA